MPGLCLDIAYVYNSQSSCELVGQTALFNATRVLLGHASPTMFYISLVHVLIVGF